MSATSVGHLEMGAGASAKWPGRACSPLTLRGIHKFTTCATPPPAPPPRSTAAVFHRINQLTAERIAFLLYCELLEAGLPAIPDIGFSRFEPDGRLWAEWVNGQPDLRAVSIFCGGRRIHAERRAHLETVEDVALLHWAVRADVAFVLGGVHAPERLADYRQAAPGRRLAVCNGMAYALAQRRRLLDGGSGRPVARSARECFLLNCAHNDRVYARVLRGGTNDAVQVR